LRVEHQLGWVLSSLLVPELDETLNLIGSIGLGYACMGVAEDTVAGIAGQEGQNALLAAAPSGDVMLFQRFFLGIGGDSVEIQVERRTPWQAGSMNLVQPSLEQAETQPVIDTGTVGGQIRALGNRVETCEEGDAFIANQIHDMTLAFGAQQLEGQQASYRLLGGDHGRTGQSHLSYDLAQSDVPHHGEEKEQAPGTGAEGSRGQTQGADISDGRGFGPKGFGAFLVEPTWKAGKAFLPKQEGQSIDTDGVSGSGQLPLDVIDGEVAFPHRDHQVSEGITDRSQSRLLRNTREESGAKVGIVAKLMAEDAEGTRGITESVGDFDRGKLLDEEGTQSFVLPLETRFGGEEEGGIAGGC